jgi:hypothetical protein
LLFLSSVLTSATFSPFRRNPANGLQHHISHDESDRIAQSTVYRTVAKFDDPFAELVHPVVIVDEFATTTKPEYFPATWAQTLVLTPSPK